jgi:hypothetical protein
MSEHEEITGFKRNVKAIAAGVGNREAPVEAGGFVWQCRLCATAW